MAITYHDGENHAYRTAFTDVNVEPSDLAEFADLLDGDLRAIEDAWERYWGELEQGRPEIFTGEHSAGVGYANGYPEVIHDGSDGIYEARGFYEAYDRTLHAERFLMRDLIKGLKTLRGAARMIHDDYLARDAANADSVAGVFAAYEQSAVVEALGVPDQDASGEDVDRPV